MDGGVADSNAPNLSIGNPNQQLSRRLQGVVRDFKRTAHYIERDNSAVVSGLDLGTNLLLIPGCATPGMFVFFVKRLSSGHDSLLTFSPHILLDVRPT